MPAPRTTTSHFIFCPPSLSDRSRRHTYLLFSRSETVIDVEKRRRLMFDLARIVSWQGRCNILRVVPAKAGPIRRVAHEAGRARCLLVHERCISTIRAEGMGPRFRGDDLQKGHCLAHCEARGCRYPLLIGAKRAATT